MKPILCRKHCQNILFLSLAIGTGTWAQVRPNAGSLLQQIDRDRTAPAATARPLPVPQEAQATADVGSESVTVQQFRFAGNKLLGEAELAPVVASYLNRPLQLAELRKAATAVAARYRAAGWVVRVYVPRQKIEGGIVTLQVIEAVFGGARIEGDATRLDKATAQRYIETAQPPGQALSDPALGRGLLLLDELPGVTATSTLVPGAATGETIVVVKLADEPLVSGNVDLDNTGGRSTGTDRLAANLALNSPLRRGDQLSASTAQTEGSSYTRLAYSLPVGVDGWRVGVNASALDYRVIISELSAAKLEGKANTAGLDLAYPVLRSRLANVTATLALDNKLFDNRSAGTSLTRYESNAATLGLAGNLYDTMGGGGANNGNLALSAGQLNLTGSPNYSADQATAQTHGDFQKLRWNASRVQTLTEGITAFAAWSGQVASKNLDSSERFYLGGASGVRAYPASEAGGAEGNLVNLELRWRLPQGFSFTAFHDWGQVRVNRDNGFNVGATTPNEYELSGSGLALAWVAAKGASLKLTYARRYEENPLRDAAGKDQDGSRDFDRFWLQASFSF